MGNELNIMKLEANFNCGFYQPIVYWISEEIAKGNINIEFNEIFFKYLELNNRYIIYFFLCKYIINN
jgi:hypothetical protein